MASCLSSHATLGPALAAATDRRRLLRHRSRLARHRHVPATQRNVRGPWPRRSHRGGRDRQRRRAGACRRADAGAPHRPGCRAVARRHPRPGQPHDRGHRHRHGAEARPPRHGGTAAGDRRGARGRVLRRRTQVLDRPAGLGTRVPRRDGDHGVRVPDHRHGARHRAGDGRPPPAQPPAARPAQDPDAARVARVRLLPEHPRRLRRC